MCLRLKLIKLLVQPVQTRQIDITNQDAPRLIQRNKLHSIKTKTKTKASNNITNKSHENNANLSAEPDYGTCNKAFVKDS